MTKYYTTLDMNNNHIINCPDIGGSGDANLTEDITSNIAVGGAPSGTKFDKDLSFTDFAKKLLRTDIAPTVSFTTSGSGLHLQGTTVNGSTLTLKITNLANTTLTCNKIEFFKGNTLLDSQTFVSGQDTYTFSFTDTITLDTTFSAKLTYSTNKVTSGNSSITFAYNRFCGSVNTLTPTETIIKSLTVLPLQVSKSYTLNNGNLSNQRFCYAYPSSLGSLTSIKDSNNFEYIGSYTKSNITVDGTQYNVYVLTDPVTISGAKQIYA